MSELDKALARFHADKLAAKPMAELCLSILYGGEGEWPQDIPESQVAELPTSFPYKAMSEQEGRRLMFCCESLPEKAALLESLWLGREAIMELGRETSEESSEPESPQPAGVIITP